MRSFFSALAAIALIIASAGAWAQPSSPQAAPLPEADSRTAALERAVSHLQSQVAGLQSENTMLKSENASLKNEFNSLQKETDNLKTSVQEAHTRLIGFNALLKFMKLETMEIHGLKGPHLIFTGANIHIRSGKGNTTEGGNPLSGLGNLIVGYNNFTHNSGKEPVRSGSHNLIIGDGHSYSSYAGLVAGNSNSISAPYATASGGFSNIAGGKCSSISGGFFNTASSDNTSISGGAGNIAGGLNSSVSGGYNNKASGQYSSVSGGLGNTATGIQSSVSGGSNRVAEGPAHWVAGNYKSP